MKKTSKPITSILKSVWQKLSRRRKRQLLVSFLIMLLSGFAEMLTLATVLPFLNILTNSNQIFSGKFIGNIYNFFDINSLDNIKFFLSALFIISIILCGALRLLNLWLNVNLASLIGSDLSCESYNRTLHQPYSVHLQRNSSFLIAASTTYVDQTVTAISNTLILCSNAIILFGLLIPLLILNPKIVIMLAFLFGLAYYCVIIDSRRRLSKFSNIIANSSRSLVKALQEGLGAIRDMILDSTQIHYLDIYKSSDKKLRKNMANVQFYMSYPRYALESFGIVLIVIFAYSMTINNENNYQILPLFGTLALGAQRMLPAMQQIYSSWASIKANSSGIENIIKLLNQSMPTFQKNEIENTRNFQDSIVFSNVFYSYESTNKNIIYNLNLQINKGQRIGIIGKTGSGKSTTIDLLMGLLKPISGSILVDGLDINSSNKILRNWRRQIAHVPQSIYLTDGTIAENIAIATSRDKIDLKKVEEAAYQAKILDFIENSPDTYNSFVGERGVQLSGGQRQRIGIARALYKNSTVLIFDEATSSLDNSTEQSVMDSIDYLSKNLTIIIVTHRLSTIKKCHKVYELDNGKLVDL